MTPMPPEVQLALGRLFRMMARPSRLGDVAEFYRIRDMLMASTEQTVAEWQPNYARDRNRGAQEEP